jgi:hypothetical protein
MTGQAGQVSRTVQLGLGIGDKLAGTGQPGQIGTGQYYRSA